MKDNILEEVWKVKEAVSNDSPGDFKTFIQFIKKEAERIKVKEPFVTFDKKKSA